MDSRALMDLAIAVAQRGADAGELPIGAVVALGDRVIADAYTQERAQGRRLVHADLLALTAADKILGWQPRREQLRLAVNLEPCVLCTGAAMAMGVDHIVFGLPSPSDGGTLIAQRWPSGDSAPHFRAPTVEAGVRRAAVESQFRIYAADAPDSGMKAWATSLIDPV